MVFILDADRKTLFFFLRGINYSLVYHSEICAELISPKSFFDGSEILTCSSSKYFRSFFLAFCAAKLPALLLSLSLLKETITSFGSKRKSLFSIAVFTYRPKVTNVFLTPCSQSARQLPSPCHCRLGRRTCLTFCRTRIRHRRTHPVFRQKHHGHSNIYYF